MKIMPRPRQVQVIGLMMGFCLLLTGFLWTPIPAYGQALNPNPPPAPVRLVFVHHSVGEAWLTNDVGNLFRGLNANNYYVSDTYYDWGPYDPDADSGRIGDHTDIGHWYNWFLGGRSNLYLAELYPTTHLTPGMGANSIPLPSGDNTVVLFKSCFVSGYTISGNPDDPPRHSSPGDPNPIWGMAHNGDPPAYTVGNVKGMYRDLLTYFAAHQDKLFILITTPPVSSADLELNPGAASLLRAINTWLVHHWLDGYRYNNVVVFDYYNVLTSNAGDPETNDLAIAGNHHRLLNGRVQHVIGLKNNFSAYTPGADSHPTWAGHQKATGEFLPLLNVAYHAWKGTGGRPYYLGRSPKLLPAMLFLLLD